MVLKSIEIKTITQKIINMGNLNVIIFKQNFQAKNRYKSQPRQRSAFSNRMFHLVPTRLNLDCLERNPSRQNPMIISIRIFIWIIITPIYINFES